MAWARSRLFSLINFGVGACCALILGYSLDVAGQESSTSDVQEDAAYRAAIKDALAEYDAHHFEEARTLFRRAHQINPNARTLRGIGMASFDLRDYVAAVRTLSASLTETRKPLTPEQRTQVEGLLERSRLFIDVYTLKVAPADARILIDGRSPDLEPDNTVLLGFGTHTLEASKAGYVLRTFPISVRGGEHKELAVTLERKAPARARAAAVPEATAKSSPFSTSTNRSHMRTIWFVAASGAALLSGSAGAYWLFENNQLSSCRNPPLNMRCDNEGAIATKRNLAVGATLVTGAAALTMAVLGILDGGSASRPSAHSGLSCSVVPAGLVCAMSF
jgi:tetratricopeptide (TPR) repeat protein